MAELDEAVAAAERAQAMTVKLRGEVEGLEERLAKALRRIDYLEARDRRIRNAYADPQVVGGG